MRKTSVSSVRSISGERKLRSHSSLLCIWGSWWTCKITQAEKNSTLLEYLLDKAFLLRFKKHQEAVYQIAPDLKC